jgi:hypothetical protein
VIFSELDISRPSYAIHPSEWKKSSRKFDLRVELLLDHRFRWLSRGDGVCVSMHDLPLTVFRSKDHRSPQSDWGDVLTSADLGLCPLYLYNVGKLGSYVLRYVLKGNHLAISELRYGALRDLSNLLPPPHGREKGVSEGYVFSTGEQPLHRLGVAFDDLPLR